MRTGGALLLQRTQPVALLGTLLPTTESGGPGWIHASLEPDPEWFRLLADPDRTGLILDRSLALTIASLLDVLLAQLRHLRGAVAFGEHTLPAGAVYVLPGDNATKTVTLYWPTDPQRFSHTASPDELSVIIREDLADQIRRSIIDELGRLAAWQP